MPVFSQLMLRLGWVRLKDYGLDIGADGRLVTSGSSLTAAPALPALPPAEDLGAAQTMPLKAAPKSLAPKAVTPVPFPRAARPSGELPSPVAVATPAPSRDKSMAQESPAETTVDSEEEWAWRAAVAKAKADTDEPSASNAEQEEFDAEISLVDTMPLKPAAPRSDSKKKMGLADTARVPGGTPSAEELEAEPQEEESGEDWDALMAAARARAESEETTRVEEQASNWEPPTEELTVVDLLEAATLADEAAPVMPAMAPKTETTIGPPPAPPATVSPRASTEDEWKNVLAAAKERESEESVRRRRAIREIERLRKRSSKPTPILSRTRRSQRKPMRQAQPSQRRRMAKGTSAPAPAAAQGRTIDLPLRASKTEVDAAPRSASEAGPLPRITARLGNG